MATTTISNPKMSFEYYWLDNGRYCNTTNRGRIYFSGRIMHYAETLQEAIEEAKKETCGKQIEIKNRYGLSVTVAIVEPDGNVIQGYELREYRGKIIRENNHKKVCDILKKGELHGEVTAHEDGTVEVSIEWGDWKHEHGYLDYLMKENGFILVNKEVTEEDGSDCYSATHEYKQV